MPTIEWNNDWNTGFNEIDEDHKNLLSVVNDVLTKCDNQADKRQLRSAANKMMKYVGSHFKLEEEILASNNFPDLNIHKATHLRLMYEALSVKNKLLEDNYSRLSAQKLSDFLLGPWLVGHLQGDDQEFARFYKKK